MSFTELYTINQKVEFPRYAYTKTEEHQSPGIKADMPHLFDEPTTWRNFHRHVNWPQSTLLIVTPILAVYYGSSTELQSKTLLWTIVYYFITSLGVTAGYHRYWAHRSFECTRLTSILLCLAATGAFQGSIQWWSRGHRAHHRWTDTDKDPYSSPRGLFFSHIGWMLVSRPKSRLGYADVEDLKSDPLVRFQNKYYLYLAVMMAFIFPGLVAFFGWGDFQGGLVFAGLCRMVVLHHSTFCVNSLAHYLGETPYDDHHTPRNSWIVALMTGGEGYHNFHHEFPQDYRNAILWHQYDPTKWLIKSLSYFGMTYNLKMFPKNEIEKGRIQMIEKQVDALKSHLIFGPCPDKLPVLSLKAFEEAVVKEGKEWLILDGVIYDFFSKSFMSGTALGSPKFIPGAISSNSSAGGCPSSCIFVIKLVIFFPSSRFFESKPGVS
ncbi:fatty acid desaturase-domain-containing protein [Sporodiniella umbellata]|nr:fatty acid desaturase-domain-containing protein [Sporodiniella umbellata]